ncbi:MAG: hypothetical protein ACJAZX_000800 [Rickettsiales bacterium]|jgi:hypothetical protein
MNYFWNDHGIFFIIFLFIFPRLTLLLSSVAFGGLFWWIGWLFMPRLLIAILATTYYWENNKILVIFSWIWALSGEAFEKRSVKFFYRIKNRNDDDKPPRNEGEADERNMKSVN